MESESFKKWLTVRSLLDHIFMATCTILERTQNIVCADDFLSSPNGMEKLDAVCMQLIAIGEAVNKIHKITEGELFQQEPDVPWNAIRGVRNFIAHDYFDVDAEEIFHIIDCNLVPLRDAVQRLQQFIINN